MDELLFNLLDNYFLTLKRLGYVNYGHVCNVIFLIGIQELVSTDYDSLLTEDDYRAMQNAIYTLFGVSCSPESIKTCSTDPLYLSNLSLLSYKVKKNEKDIRAIEETRVIKPRDDNEIIIDDIIIIR